MESGNARTPKPYSAQKIALITAWIVVVGLVLAVIGLYQESGQDLSTTLDIESLTESIKTLETELATERRRSELFEVRIKALETRSLEAMKRAQSTE